MIPLAISTWGEEERQALLKVVDSGNFTMGATVSEQQWAQIEAAARAAAAKVDATTAQLMKSGPGNHDVWFLGPGGSAVKIAYQVNLVISGYTGCRLPEEDRAGR